MDVYADSEKLIGNWRGSITLFDPDMEVPYSISLGSKDGKEKRNDIFLAIFRGSAGNLTIDGRPEYVKQAFE